MDLMTVMEKKWKNDSRRTRAIYDSQKAALVTTRMAERREIGKTSSYLDVKFLECKNLKRIHPVLFTLRSLQLKMAHRELARLDAPSPLKQPTISVLCYYLQVLDIRTPYLSTVADIAIYSHNNKQTISRFAHRLMGTPSSRYLMSHHEVTVSAVISKVV